MKKHYVIRHQILKILASHQDSFSLEIDSIQRLLSYKDLKLKFPKTDDNTLLDNLQYLVDSKEIYSSMELNYSKFSILREGRNSVTEKKYKSIGYKELRDRLFDYLKLLSTFILLIIAMATFIQNVYQTERNKAEIKTLQKQFQEISNSVNQRKH